MFYTYVKFNFLFTPAETMIEVNAYRMLNDIFHQEEIHVCLEYGNISLREVFNSDTYTIEYKHEGDFGDIHEVHIAFNTFAKKVRDAKVCNLQSVELFLSSI